MWLNPYMLSPYDYWQYWRNSEDADVERFLTGDQTPVLFGSALTNFGIGPFLDALAELLPAPGPRESDRGPVPPQDPDFSGFIFKIQANMDPRHRDRMAFLRVCSGRFEKDMEVFNPRLGRSVRLTRPHRLFGQERETVEEAFPGDVVGLVKELGVVTWVSLGAIPAAVPHTRPVPILGTEAAPGLLRGGVLPGPTGLLRVPSAALSGAAPRVPRYPLPSAVRASRCPSWAASKPS